jgi:hypothetical protein
MGSLTTKAERKTKFFALMEHYVLLGDDLPYVESFAELTRILDEMAAVKNQIDALIDEQARINRLC